ncbi:MAG: helix-turn-helix domain-containing protein, partial [Aestuariivirga sp.]
VQINRLRQKIEADPSLPLYLQTVRGSGYVLLID